jgi:hypothetical protein
VNKVQGSRFKVQGSRFKVQGSRFKVQGSRFKVQGSRFKVQGSRFKVKSSRWLLLILCKIVNPLDSPKGKCRIAGGFNHRTTVPPIF